MFKNKTIHKRVIDYVNSKITEAQAKFDEGVDILKVECEDLKLKAEQDRDSKIKTLEDKLVNEIINKLI